jgi:hypothetical protein
LEGLEEDAAGALLVSLYVVAGELAAGGVDRVFEGVQVLVLLFLELGVLDDLCDDGLALKDVDGLHDLGDASECVAFCVDPLFEE